jgi:hypothetical protein
MYKKRKNDRVEAKNLIALVPHGVCQVIDLNNNGISFKCFDEHDFPGEWAIDIYGSNGLSVEELQIKKIWEHCISNRDVQTLVSLEIGAEFKSLTSSQKTELNSYLQQLREAENNS